MIGKKIKELRKSHKLTLEQLAHKIGTSKSYIWEIENKDVDFSHKKLAAICEVFEIRAGFLLGLEDEGGNLQEQILKLGEDNNKIFAIQKSINNSLEERINVIGKILEEKIGMLEENHKAKKEILQSIIKENSKR